MDGLSEPFSLRSASTQSSRHPSRTLQELVSKYTWLYLNTCVTLYRLDILLGVKIGYYFIISIKSTNICVTSVLIRSFLCSKHKTHHFHFYTERLLDLSQVQTTYCNTDFQFAINISIWHILEPNIWLHFGLPFSAQASSVVKTEVEVVFLVPRFKRGTF